MRFLPLLLGTLLFQAPAKADKFWLSDPAGQKNVAEGSSPDYLEGVLIAESDEGYHIRIVGGEVLLPKKSVFKIEKDDLSIDAIVKAEGEASKATQAADQERQMAQAAARRKQQVEAVEAAARKSEVKPAPAPAAPARAVVGPVFDPVLGVLRDTSGRSANDLQRDAQLAWTLTGDVRYLTLLRQLRRLR